jgi:prophage antirepressor-like protein
MPFEFEGAAVRVVKIDGEPWFVAADVCRALGLASCKKNGYSRHLKSLNASEISPASRCGVILSGHGMAHANLISESGLYKLVMRCRKLEARRFQDWVTGTVLPAIRKDGAYIMGEEKVASGELEETQFILRAMQMLNAKAERLAGEVQKLTAEKRAITAERDEYREELHTVTLDEYRALTHRYMTHAEKVRLSKRASKLYQRRFGRFPGKQSRILVRYGKEIETKVNIYPRSILELAEAQLLEELGVVTAQTTAVLASQGQLL